MELITTITTERKKERAKERLGGREKGRATDDAPVCQLQ